MGDVGYMTVSLHLSGKGFDPRKLNGKFACAFTILQELGKLIKGGPGRGERVSSHGHCYFEADETVQYDQRIEKIIEIYLAIKELNLTEDLGIDWFHISILFSGEQGNMELNPSQLGALAKSEEGIAMTYIGSTDFDYRKQRKLQRLRKGLYKSKIDSN